MISLPRLTFCRSSKIKRWKVKVIRPLWLLKSALVGGGAYLGRCAYRPHSLLHPPRCYVFLPCDAMQARSLLSPGVCLSFSLPSITLVYCIRTAEELLSRPSSIIILVFLPQRRYQIPRGTCTAGSETVRDRPTVAMEH